MGNSDWRNLGGAFAKILAQDKDWEWGEECERKAFVVESSRRPPMIDLRGRAKMHSALCCRIPGKAACIPAQPSFILLHLQTLPLLLPFTWPKPLLWTMKCQPCISVSLPCHTIDFFRLSFLSLSVFFLSNL